MMYVTTITKCQVSKMHIYVVLVHDHVLKYMCMYVHTPVQDCMYIRTCTWQCVEVRST